MVKALKISFMPLLLMLVSLSACSKDKDEAKPDNSAGNFDGIYSGFAFEGTMRVASWKISISNGTITPIITAEPDDVGVTGTVNALGQVTATTIDGDGHLINIAAVISGSAISGTWVDSVDEDQGTVSGNKEIILMPT